MKKSLFLTIALTLLLFISPKTASAFSDLSLSHPNYQAISYLEENGIVNGYKNGEFRPNQLINRVEFLTLVMSASNIKLIAPHDLPFLDTDDSAWYSKNLTTALAKGWVNGYEDKTFKPDSPINNAEAVKVLAEVQSWELPENEITNPFFDVKITDWFGPHISYAKKNFFLQTNGNYFQPQKAITRAEMSEIIYRSLTVDKNFEIQYASQSAATTDYFIHNEIPFAAQAPFGEWNDIRQREACEEAAVYLAIKWFRGEKITLQEAKDEMIKMYDHQVTNYWTAHDTSAEDTLNWLVKDYFHYNNAYLQKNIQIDDLKHELYRGNLVVLPVNARKLDNPNFASPGPLQHTILILGYDPATEEYIVHEPGTLQGANFRYSKTELNESLHDYASGSANELPEQQKNMIVIGPPQ